MEEEEQIQPSSNTVVKVVKLKEGKEAWDAVAKLRARLFPNAPPLEPLTPPPLSALRKYRIVGQHVFELIDIQIKELHPKRASMSVITTENSHERKKPIYKLLEDEDGERIPIGESLTLIGPSRPPPTDTSVYIWFGDKSWNWYFSLHFGKSVTPVEWGIPVTTTVVDKETDSKAEVCFQLINRAAEAKLEFQFVDEENRHIEISDGVIFVTTNGVPDTKRFVRRFGGKAPLLSQKRKNPPPDITNQILPISRSAFAVPKGAELCVSVELTYHLYGTVVSQRKISHTCNFKVPLHPSEEVQVFPNIGGEERPKLSLKVYWTDPFFRSE